MHTDFIGIFDNILTPADCQRFVDYFNSMKSLNLVYNRQDLKDAPAHKKQDETVFMLEHTTLPVHKRNPVMERFVDKFWPCYEDYVKEYSILGDIETHGIVSARLQKTLPGQGYHQWHFESAGSSVSTRIVAWSIYLNDVEHGGETEFLYQKRRVSAKTGRVVIWPAGYTHVHRGNPPLSGEKYLLTGWLEFMGPTK
jgi:hypothetical protein